MSILNHVRMNVADDNRVIYTVSELNGSVRLLLGSHFGTIWVEGEISNLATPSSGHFYFTLKDADAQVRCALFRGSARNLGFRPENGIRVLARVQVSLYEPRGDYQLMVEYLEPGGDGALRRAFEALKQKLAAEGLFDQWRKRSIPVLPKRIGVITSPTGAAVRDILSVLKRRFPALPIVLFPVKVQGLEAKGEIVRAIALADRLRLCDVLILARGGGSLEDLWAFNEEVVARAIADCNVPIISGVGHETDLTIADLVADVRAPTPSAAAEAATPDVSEWQVRLLHWEGRLSRQMRQQWIKANQQWRFLEKRLEQAHPRRQLQRYIQRLDELELRLQRVASRIPERQNHRLQTLVGRLQRQHPGQNLLWLAARIQGVQQRLTGTIQLRLEREGHRTFMLGQQLHAVSPLATLGRGFSITVRKADGQILRDPREVLKGELIETRLTEGTLLSRVE